MAEDKKKDEIAVIEINEEFMKQKLYEFRGCKVLLDADLAEVYGYELKAFNQQVKRNIERFQNDMMFQLSDNEVEYLRSQFVTANISSKSRSNPYVFTEQGVYMLMTVLKGELAVRQSIALVRTFKRMKDYILENRDLIGQREILQLSMETANNRIEINKINSDMISLEKQISDVAEDKLIQREKQLAVLEDKIKRENQDYEDKYNNENVAKLRAFDERDTAKKELQEILKDYYVDIKSILSKVHYREYQYMDKVGKKDLILMIEKEYELGRLLGKTSKEVSLELGCYLIGIYDYFQEYSKSFDVMLVMAELSDYWVDLETATLNWANKEHILYKLYNEIERALVNYRVKNERRKNFEGYLQTIKKIRGY